MNNYDFLDGSFIDMMPVNMTMMPNNNTAFNNMNAVDLPGSGNNNGIEANTALYTPQEALTKGNLFPSLYQQYKNYRPQVLSPRNEQEKLYLDYAALAFAAHELNLYLDNFPNDRTIIRLFNDYRTRANQALRTYEEKYGPIVIRSEQLNQFPWMWEKLSFPWDNKGGM